MLLNYYISDLRNSLSKDDDHIDDRYLIELINQFRAIYIKNEFNRNRVLPQELIQTVSGIRLDLSKQLDVDFIVDDSRVLKSSVEIPSIIHTNKKELVDRVWDGVLLNLKFNHIEYDRAAYAGNNKTNKKSIFSFIYNNRLYLKLKRENPNINLITNLTLRAVFENPLDLIPLQHEGYFNELNFEYPMTKAIWGQVKSNILNNALQAVQANIIETKDGE